MQKYLTIHGHFYQPPRENPWTEAIEQQPSAHPEHDWNEKINAECYYPNGYSRILDAQNRITEIVNNYSQINFNFGPTLLSWLETHAPEVYARILEADREVAERNDGHGPAIAQAYNHIILPLAPPDDQRTQIIWGVADFRHRFRREPESIWLPETALNQTTLNLLTEFGFKYIILSPYQALRVRPLAGHDSDWIAVENGTIDVRQPYRCFARDPDGEKIPERFIDIFFYHGELARGISFEHLLHDARHLADRLESSYGDGLPEALISIATDGETYGHHERFGDMALAFLLHVEAPARQIRPITYGAYLAKHPPAWEVELKPGPNGEGTSWSCAHGVGRWYRNCGCHTGGELHWNQEWRGPLRQALDHLRNELRKITASFEGDLFCDALAARNDYIEVILDRSPERIEAFLQKHLLQPLSPASRQQAIAIMEMERQLQLMYTSCGWFFSELSGIETVQIIRYAARAIQIAEHLTGAVYEDRFLEDLKKAKSNLPRFKDGAGVYQMLVKPSIISFDKVVNHFAITSKLGVIEQNDDRYRAYIYEIQHLDRHEIEKEGSTCLVGAVRIHSTITLREEEFGYLLIQADGAEKIRCAVRSLSTGWEYASAKERVLQTFPTVQNQELDSLMKLWGGAVYSLSDLFYDERQKVADTLIRQQLMDIAACAEEIYTRSQPLIAILSSLGLPLPDEIIQPVKITLSNIILNEITRVQDEADLPQYEKALQAAHTAQQMGIELRTEKASAIFQRILEQQLRDVIATFSLQNTVRLSNLIEIADRLALKLHLTPLQNYLYTILCDHVNPAIEKLVQGEGGSELYETVSHVLRIAYKLNFSIAPYKERLKGYEQPLSQDPTYWP